MGKKSRNKNKGGGGRKAGGGGGASSSRVDAAGTFGRAWSTNLPTFNRRDAKDAQDGEGAGLYQRYKRATTAVKDFLKSRVPADAGLEVTAINDLSKAAEHIMQRVANAAADASVEAPIEIPKEILRELDVSIDLREKVGESFGGDGGDKGHRYMLSTLKHVRKVLLVTRKSSKILKRSRQRSSAAGVAASSITGKSTQIMADSEVGGKFSALLTVEDDESDEELDGGEAKGDDDIPLVDEEMIRSGKLPEIAAPEGTEEQARLSIEEDLIKGGDRFRCILFLRSLDMFMMNIDGHFQMLKRVMRKDFDSSFKHDCDSTLQLLMECAVAVNAAINSIRQMELALVADYEHLSSFYSILAVMVLPEMIASVESKLSEAIRRDKPALAKTFAADVLETAFHNRGHEKAPGIVRRMVKTSKLKHDFVESTAMQINQFASFEVMSQHDVAINPLVAEIYRAHAQKGVPPPKPHSWLTGFYIGGGERCILNTQKLTQQILGVIQRENKLVSKGGLFGPMWNESTRPARKIEGDLNALLAEDILPELFAICKFAPIKSLPGHRELLPLLDVLAEQMRNKDRPVPVSLTFGLHAILTSILVLQGNGDVSKLALASKQTWKKLFSQIDEQSTTDLPTPPIVFQNLNAFKEIVHLAEPVGPVSSPTSVEHAFWNPVCSGSFLLFGTYIMSIGLGSATVDGFAQLRFTLHLFNALKDQGLVSEEIELLSNLDKAFGKTKAVWVTLSRPKKGEFVKSLLMAWGQSASDASRTAETERKLHLSLQGEAPQTQAPRNTSDIRNTTRALDPIEPENFSPSYRRLVLQDFSDAVDTYSIRNCSEEQQKDYSDYLEFVSRVNMTRDAIDDDEDNVIPFNFVVVGGVLNEFIVELSREMGWDTILNSALANMPNEMRQNHRGADGRKLRGFATSEESYERTGLVPMLVSLLGELEFGGSSFSPAVQKAAAFMKSFFTKDKKDRCKFFVEPSDAKAKVSANPLLGDYPYGRTGRTMMDPLKAFMVFKRSKAGKAIVRLIKPGKQTPYYVEDGLTESPYGNEQAKFKLPKKANGRSRHIADYTLDELIELGWDGAKYCPNSVKVLKGTWCPYVPGYDSDPEDRYEPVDVAAGRRQGLIGLTKEDVGAYMNIPNKGIVQLNAK